MELEFKDITEKIIGSAFEVHRILGYGFLEKVYKQAMFVEIQLRGLRAEMERPIEVEFKNHKVGHFYADLLVEDSVLVEIKVSEKYCSKDEAQILNELKATGIRVGLLINFGRDRVEFKRMVSSFSSVFVPSPSVIE